MALCPMGMEVAKERVSVVISATMLEGFECAIYNPVHPTAKVFQAQANLPKKKTPVLPSPSARRHRTQVCREGLSLQTEHALRDKLWSFS